MGLDTAFSWGLGHEGAGGGGGGGGGGERMLLPLCILWVNEADPLTLVQSWLRSSQTAK